MTATRKSVLFVCMGNICRSPAAENVFRHVAAQRGVIDRLTIDSAGTIGYHEGEPPDSRMRATLARRGYPTAGSARQVTRADLERFDLIACADERNLRDVRALDCDGRFESRVRLLCEFHPNPPVDCSVPDPYYGGPQGFEHVIDLIEGCCPGVLEHLLGTES